MDSKVSVNTDIKHTGDYYVIRTTKLTLRIRRT